MARRWLEQVPQDGQAPLYRAVVRSLGVDPLREPLEPATDRLRLPEGTAQEPQAGGKAPA